MGKIRLYLWLCKEGFEKYSHLPPQYISFGKKWTRKPTHPSETLLTPGPAEQGSSYEESCLGAATPGLTYGFNNLVWKSKLSTWVALWKMRVTEKMRQHQEKKPKHIMKFLYAVKGVAVSFIQYLNQSPGQGRGILFWEKEVGSQGHCPWYFHELFLLYATPALGFLWANPDILIIPFPHSFSSSCFII